MIKILKSFFISTLLLGYAIAAGAKPSIILVHGAFQDADHAWGRVKPKLEALGYTVYAINLPGRGEDRTPIENITTDLYRDKVLLVVNAQKGPVVLVGHSFGGVTISNVAEAAPEKIKALVYLAAYLPKDGDSLQTLSRTDTESKMGKDGNFMLSQDYKYASIKESARGMLFGNDASLDDRKMIADGLVREPAAPTGMPAKLTAERFGKVPKYYIRTTLDLVIGPALQDRMAKDAKVKKVYIVKGGHGAPITQSAQVVKDIAAIAGR